MCLSIKFKNACISVYGGCKTSPKIGFPKPVNDESVAIISLNKNTCSIDEPKVIYCNKQKRPEKELTKINESEYRKICLLLESPHISEYDSNGNPLGPALSTTGMNISNHIEGVLNQALKDNIIELDNDKYILMLVEGVSYQCSNGEDLSIKENKEKRNKVFSNVWESGGKQDFINRIKKYDPILIINSSTGGLRNANDLIFLNGKINQSLKDNGFEAVNSAHPSSSWFWKKGLKK